MAFVFPELVIESILRDGLRDMFNKIGTEDDQIPDIFADLTIPSLEKDYGEAELDKIRTMVKSEVQLIQGFILEDQKYPCVSINLASDMEAENNASMDDFVEEIDVPNDQREIIRSIRDNESLLLMIGSNEALVTKYLYMIVKYILVSRKKDLIARGLDITTFDGSDFSRMPRLENQVFLRYLTLRARFVEHSWNVSKVSLVDSADDTAPVIDDMTMVIDTERRPDQSPRDDEEDMTLQSVVNEDLDK